MLRIRNRIRWICMSLGLPDPDPLVWGTVWISIRLQILLSSSKNRKKNLDSYCFVTYSWLLIFEKWCKYNCKKYGTVISKKTLKTKLLVAILKVTRNGSEPGSVNKMYWSPDPDLYQKITDPQHWLEEICTLLKTLFSQIVRILDLRERIRESSLWIVAGRYLQ